MIVNINYLQTLIFTAMKKLFLFTAMFMLAATSCDSVANTPNDADNESRVTEDIMDMLINDLLMGVCVPRGCGYGG